MFSLPCFWLLVLCITLARAGPASGPKCSDVNKIVSRFRAGAEVTAFCSSYLSIKTRTFTATSTSTNTAIAATSITLPPVVETDTITQLEIDTTTTTLTETFLTDSTTTTAVTVTVTGTSTTTSTSYICPGANERRDAATAAVPDTRSLKKPAPVPICLQGFKQKFKEGLKSACGCLSVPVPSTTITRTATASTTISHTSTITLTSRTTLTATRTQQSAVSETSTTTAITAIVTSVETSIATFVVTTATTETISVSAPNTFKLNTGRDPNDQGGYNPQAWAVLTASYGSGRLGTIGNKLDYTSGQAFRLDSRCRLVAVGGDFDGQVMTTQTQGVRASSSNIFFAPAGRPLTTFAESFCVVTPESRLNCDFQGGATRWIESRSRYEDPQGPWWQIGRSPFVGPIFGLPLVQ